MASIISAEGGLRTEIHETTRNSSYTECTIFGSRQFKEGSSDKESDDKKEGRKPEAEEERTAKQGSDI